MAENETTRDAAKAAKSGATPAAAAIDAAKVAPSGIDATAAEVDAEAIRSDLEADLRALRQDVARLGETVAAIAQSRADAIDAAVHRSPWSTAVAALCVGFCLGLRSRR